jgi:hypothetical protein
MPNSRILGRDWFELTVAPIAKKISENSVRDFMVVLLRDVCDMMLLNAALKIK